MDKWELSVEKKRPKKTRSKNNRMNQGDKWEKSSAK